jgi:hypothetical protein
MRSFGLALFGVLVAGVASADEFDLRGDERETARPLRSRVLVARQPCIDCGGGLPWGGLRKVRRATLPWGGLPDYCPPERFTREVVVVTKG